MELRSRSLNSYGKSEVHLDFLSYFCLRTCVHEGGSQRLVHTVFLYYVSLYLLRQDRSLNLECTDYLGPRVLSVSDPQSWKYSYTPLDPFFFFESGFYAVQDGLKFPYVDEHDPELLTLLSLPHKFWGYRCTISILCCQAQNLACAG